jgi:hypothetical protein
VAFKTNNTIKHHVKVKDRTTDVHNLSGVYQMGRTFRARYNKHIREIQTNGKSSKFAQHILNTTHNYDTKEKTMKILHVERKGQMLDTLENYYIYTITRQGLQMNETSTSTYMYNPIYEFLTKANSNIKNPTHSRTFYQPPHISTPIPIHLPLPTYSTPLTSFPQTPHPPLPLPMSRDNKLETIKRNNLQ